MAGADATDETAATATPAAATGAAAATALRKKYSISTNKNMPWSFIYLLLKKALLCSGGRFSCGGRCRSAK